MCMRLLSGRCILFLLVWQLGSGIRAQDTVYARSVINELCSPKFAGRGYVDDGDWKAAVFLRQELQKAGVQAWNGQYQHHFDISVNTLPVARVRADGRLLRPGIDFLADPSCGSVKQTLRLRMWSWSDTLSYPSGPWLHPEATPAIPDEMLRHRVWGKRLNNLLQLRPQVWVRLVNKLPAWGVALKPEEGCELIIRQDKPPHSATLRLNIKNSFQPVRNCSNVLGFIPGTRNSDTLMVLTAHYDHLGKMDKAVFPGANDNATGVAMVLDMARSLVKNPLPYGVVVVFFAAEEAGLLGSAALIRDRVLPLERIRFLLNMDLMGTGETGMTVVNATVFPKEFSAMDSLNREHQFLPAINKRGKAANSDHYFFTEAGVPSFFGYLSGPRPAYHATDDIPETLTLYGYTGTFLLFRHFLEHLSNNP